MGRTCLHKRAKISQKKETPFPPGKTHLVGASLANRSSNQEQDVAKKELQQENIALGSICFSIPRVFSWSPCKIYSLKILPSLSQPHPIERKVHKK